MPLTPEDVQNKRFTVVRFGKSGYDEEEVDTFLDEIEAEMRRLIAEGESLRSAAEAAAAAAAAPAPEPEPVPAPAAPPVEEPNETALRTLLLAQRTADDAIAQAKAEAEKLLNEARMHAASIERDAQATHAAKTAELSAQREGVEAQIAELRDFEREFRSRLRAQLEGQLANLEQLASAAPDRPTTSLRPGRGDAAPEPDRSEPPPAATTGFASIPGLAPPASGSGAGPFGQAPPPPPAPAPTPLPPHPAVGAPKPDLATGFDTDVDADSDVPSRPPAQADDTADEGPE